MKKHSRIVLFRKSINFNALLMPFFMLILAILGIGVIIFSPESRPIGILVVFFIAVIIVLGMNIYLIFPAIRRITPKGYKIYIAEQKLRVLTELVNLKRELVERIKIQQTALGILEKTPQSAKMKEEDIKWALEIFSTHNIVMSDKGDIKALRKGIKDKEKFSSIIEKVKQLEELRDKKTSDMMQLYNKIMQSIEELNKQIEQKEKEDVWLTSKLSEYK